MPNRTYVFLLDTCNEKENSPETAGEPNVKDVTDPEFPVLFMP